MQPLIGPGQDAAGEQQARPINFGYGSGRVCGNQIVDLGNDRTPNKLVEFVPNAFAPGARMLRA